MRLSELLREQKEAILQEFEDFARTHTAPGTSMAVEALRDHAARMLDAMALDLEQPQTADEQERKGKGDAPVREPLPRSAAEEHGLDRAESGFTMEETFAEYRALRASVMRHYVGARSHQHVAEIQDVIRFNEAIDQALAESVTEYAKAVSRYRDMFLAVLGHDLRSPLNAVLNASTFLAENAHLSVRDRGLAATIVRSTRTMAGLVEDLLEYTSEELGQGITLRRSRVDLGAVAAEVVEECKLGYADREIRLNTRGDVVGEWDPGRLRQALSNLVTNALRHAPQDSLVSVSIFCDEPADCVVAAVHNLGAPIPEHERELIFEPFYGNRHAEVGGRMGIGLHITRLMAEAHGGRIEVESAPQTGTTFCMHLPRRARDSQRASGDVSDPA